MLNMATQHLPEKRELSSLSIWPLDITIYVLVFISDRRAHIGHSSLHRAGSSGFLFDDLMMDDSTKSGLMIGSSTMHGLMDDGQFDDGRFYRETFHDG